MSGETITTIRNNHVEGCGEPPEFDHDDYSYLSYFENEHGEQSIFVFDDDEDVAKLYIADAGWDNPQEIPKRELEDTTIEEATTISRILLARDEKLWLKACLEAVQFRL
jgi:hypothetical protein